ncbi:MAG: hypothetical protein J6V72_21120, partial [Kiritimatiellae bacterium]|nr:hypothetical protein [Kiritimatiellia bacterium]
GDDQKPSHVRLGGVAAEWTGTRHGDHYGEPDIMFFDVIGARAGTVVDLDMRSADGSYSFVEGILFDSVDAPAKGLRIMIR